MVLRARVAALPLVGSLPDQPPKAVQLLMFVEDQRSIEVPPLPTVAGLALRTRVGAAAEGVEPGGVTVSPEGPSTDEPPQPLSAAITA